MFPKSRVGPKRDQTGIRRLADACDLFCVTRVAHPNDGVLRTDKAQPMLLPGKNEYERF